MAEVVVPYLQCFGLPRQLLHCTVRLLGEADGAEGTDREAVLSCVTAEVAKRGELAPQPAQPTKALTDLLRLGWLREDDSRLALTSAGWLAFGRDRAGRSFVPHTEIPELSAREAVETLLEILCQLRWEPLGRRPSLRYDPRASRRGEILEEDLREWASWYGVSPGVFLTALAWLQRQQWVATTPIGIWSDVVHLHSLRADMLPEEVKRGPFSPSVLVPVMSTMESRSNYALVDVKAEIVSYLKAAEEDNDQRIRRIPDCGRRVGFANYALIALLIRVEHCYGIPFSQLIQHIASVFPGTPMEPVWSEASGGWWIPKSFLEAIRSGTPDVSEGDAYLHFQEHRFPGGLLGQALEQLCADGKMRVCGFPKGSGCELNERGPTLRMAEPAGDKLPQASGKPDAITVGGLRETVSASTTAADVAPGGTPRDGRGQQPELPPLTDAERRVFELLDELAPGSGLTGKQIIAELQGNLGQGTLTRHIIPALKQMHGVTNTGGIGYHMKRG